MSGIAAAATEGTREGTPTEGQEPESEYRAVTVGEWIGFFL